jgi:hypothetical protein
VHLPNSEDFSLEKKRLIVELSDATRNMQDNKSSFERWIVYFKKEHRWSTKFFIRVIHRPDLVMNYLYSFKSYGTMKYLVGILQ